MMYLIISAIFATSSFAQTTPLLKLEQYSGYTPPQYAMAAQCALEANFHVVAKIQKERTEDGWKIETNIDNLISDSEMNQVQLWINQAAAGPFKRGANPCDIGTFNVVTATYPLILSQDCGKKVENLHPSAAKLIAWLRQACTLEGKKE